MRVLYMLYGKKVTGSIGVVKKLGGLKISEGCILMLEEKTPKQS